MFAESEFQYRVPIFLRYWESTLGTIEDTFRYLCPIDLYWYRVSVSAISDIFRISADTIRYRYFQISEEYVHSSLVGRQIQYLKNIYIYFLFQLSETYGPVFTIYLSSAPAVVLIGYDCVKEALIDNGNMFSFRGPSEFGDLLFKGYGVILTNGERWKQLRRFSLSTLRNFGMGKRSIEERIQEEARYLTEKRLGRMKVLYYTVDFTHENLPPIHRFEHVLPGTAFDPTHLLTLAVSNVICSVVFGERFDYEDVKFRTLLTLLKEIISLMSSTWGIVTSQYLSKTLSFIPGPHQKIFTNLEKLKDFIAESWENHKVTLDPNCPRDFIDCFLIKMEEEKSNPKTEFHFDNLFGTVMDLFFAGTETTSTTLKNGLLYLLKISRRGKQTLLVRALQLVLSDTVRYLKVSVSDGIGRYSENIDIAHTSDTDIRYQYKSMGHNIGRSGPAELDTCCDVDACLRSSSSASGATGLAPCFHQMAANRGQQLDDLLLLNNFVCNLLVCVTVVKPVVDMRS
ncbi:unnamed protein product [Ranitomeya imitator]|uniref:Cytochrome P450 n=1 Tax=Ranitomeya imitator TaxID=111125 RepID=A0ABN9M290_9NEOB|nr:unnamed protein product [Ranitomeya imitator]